MHNYNSQPSPKLNSTNEVIFRPNRRSTAPFFAFLYLPLLVDQINGFLQLRYGVNISVAQIIKGLYLIYFFIYVNSYNSGNAIKVAALGSLMLLGAFNGLFVENLAASQLDNFVFISKVIFFPISYFFFYLFIKFNRDWISARVYSFSRGIFLFFIVSILSSYFGFGQARYGTTETGVSVGQGGFFLAGNEMSAAFLVLYVPYLNLMLKRNVGALPLATLLFSGALVAFLVGTKTTMVGYLICTLGSFVIMFRFGGIDNISIIRNVRLLVGFFIFIFIAFFGYSLAFTEVLEAYIERWEFFYENAPDFLTFAMSGRNEWVISGLEFYFEKYGLLAKLIGLGWIYFQHAIPSESGGLFSTEVDIIDLLLAHGFLGTALIYYFWLSILTISWKQHRRNSSGLNSVMILLWIVLIGISSFAGHIIYSALVGFYLAFYMALAHNGVGVRFNE